MIVSGAQSLSPTPALAASSPATSCEAQRVPISESLEWWVHRGHAQARQKQRRLGKACNLGGDGRGGTWPPCRMRPCALLVRRLGVARMDKEWSSCHSCAAAEAPAPREQAATSLAHATHGSMRPSDLLLGCSLTPRCRLQLRFALWSALICRPASGNTRLIAVQRRGMTKP